MSPRLTSVYCFTMHCQLRDLSGWIDPLIINRAYLDFAADAPRYGQLQPSGVLRQMNESFHKPDGCKAKLESCYASGSSVAVCKDAWAYCVSVRRITN